MQMQKYKLTPAEEDIIQTCKARAIRDFTLTAFVTSGVVWTATRRLGYGYRINLCGGAGIFSGMWLFDRSLNSCLDNILSLEGSRMQSELAKILLTKHRDNPWTMKIIKKHFYPEKVFDDSSLDKPISRWRFRNYYGDSAAESQRSNDSETYDTNTDLEPKQFTDPSPMQSLLQMSSSAEVTADPFDCVFGYPEAREEIRHPDTTEVSPKRRIRSHKRTHRQHRTRHTEVSSDTTSKQSPAQLERQVSISESEKN
ncbi:hypothetical protein BVC80_9035g14 [Macleaya cordata]|uniref:Uncharacterized protein n=1 Tax=Macleaya cordata TaxID=56857 RepID=A0A200QYM0_MACCD|nr:hypothetical protein BVC80_9035g14 [Macleaya cordata]